MMKHSTKAAVKENLAGYLFLLPSLIGFIAFIVFPVIASVFLSFTSWDFLSGFNKIEFVGLKNFITLLSFSDDWFSKSMINTIVFTLVTVPVSVGFGLIIAVILNKDVYMSGLIKVLFFIPYISSIVASAVVWMVVLHPSNGPVTALLHSLGVADPPKWFVDMKFAFPSIMAFSVWQILGYQVLVYMSGLKGIPEELYEAADIDGVSGVQKFFYVTIPMISPTTFFLSVMGIIGSFKVFDSISVLTQGGPGNSTTVIAFYIYREAFEHYRMGTANAAAWVMFVLIFAVTMFQLRYQKKWVNYDL